MRVNNLMYQVMVCLLFTMTSIVNAEIKSDTPGIAHMTNSIAKSNTIIAGELNAKHGKFEGDIIVDSDKAILNASSVKGSVTIKSKHKTPVLELYCSTKISGDVIFKDKAGVIKKSSDSIIKGKVINGSIEEAKSTEKCD